MEKNDNQNIKHSDLINESYEMINYEDSNKIQNDDVYKYQLASKGLSCNILI